MSPPNQSQHVLAPPAKAAIFLVVTVPAGSEDEVRDFLTGVSGQVRTVGFRYPEVELSCVVGVGARLWDRLFGSVRPAGLHPFQPIVGETHTAVATPGDLLFHLRAGRLDLCFELATQLMNALGAHGEVVDEVHGFRYLDERDLLGFVDGSENPAGRAAEVAALIGDEDPAFAGGSYVVVQKYLHDLTAWNAMSVEQQELVIGRHKLDNVEFPDEEKPTNSHLALNTIEDPDGTQRQIVRDNMPFGRVGAGEFGTYFIGYTAFPDVIEQMLTNMFIGDPPGNHDRILDFSTAVTGALFFVPTADFLDDPSDVLAAARQTRADDDPEPPARTGPGSSPSDGSSSDGSLGIGSLQRSGI